MLSLYYNLRVLHVGAYRVNGIRYDRGERGDRGDRGDGDVRGGPHRGRHDHGDDRGCARFAFHSLNIR